MKVAGLFAGIGGIELGFRRAGFETGLFCEIEPAAKAVLEAQFPDVPVIDDVRAIPSLPGDIEVLTAGFPCQDLSQAGRTKGIDGARSGLVREVFRLLERRPVPWVVIENVSFMLRLDGGSAMRLIADNFERMGYRWAYRVLDSRAFGLPQRRERVYFVASLEQDPATLLFGTDVGSKEPTDHNGYACGFYWTEGSRGLGWAIDCVPTLKGGSTIGIPSPPAIWVPNEGIVTPDLRDTERMQGFEADWTLPAERVARRGSRWKLVGNAVSVDAAEWVARSIRGNSGPRPVSATPIRSVGGWPTAGFGGSYGRYKVDVSMWPDAKPRASLLEFLEYPTQPLSARATRGFTSRLFASTLNYPEEFRAGLEQHLIRLEQYPMAQQRLSSVAVREAA